MTEKIQKLLAICSELEELGEGEIANQIFEKISKKIKFIKRNDWTGHQICGDFPKVDIRCLVFCCSPAKPCMFRDTVLQKMGLTLDDYTRMKEQFAQKIKGA